MRKKKYIGGAAVFLTAAVLAGVLTHQKEQKKLSELSEAEYDKTYDSIITFNAGGVQQSIIADGKNRTEEFKREEFKARRAVENYFGHKEELKDWIYTHLGSSDSMTLEFKFRGKGYTASWIEGALVSIVASGEQED